MHNQFMGNGRLRTCLDWLKFQINWKWKRFYFKFPSKLNKFDFRFMTELMQLKMSRRRFEKRFSYSDIFWLKFKLKCFGYFENTNHCRLSYSWLEWTAKWFVIKSYKIWMCAEENKVQANVKPWNVFGVAARSRSTTCLIQEPFYSLSPFSLSIVFYS